MTGAPSRREAGFTLTEALVSLAIVALMATLLLGGVTTATLLARNSRSQDMALDEVQAVQTILRDRITLFRPVARLDMPQPMMDSVGTADMFDFYSVQPVGSPDRGIQKFRLMQSSVGDLILYRAPELTDRIDLRARTALGWRPATLMRGIAGLSISYYGALPGQRERRWRGSWYGASIAPELVRIRVTFPEGDRRVWPDLVIRPAPTVDLACNPERQDIDKCGART